MEKNFNMTKDDSPKRMTLMDVYEQLSANCERIDEVENLARNLNQKLNRTEGDVAMGMKSDMVKGVAEPTKNIVELFASISLRLESSINRIANEIMRSTEMID